MAMALDGSSDLDRVILDHRVGQQLPAHLVDPGARRRRVRLGELQFDQLALADLADPAKAQPLQGVADRLALRIEYSGFQADMDTGFHGPGIIAPYRAP